MITAVSGGVGTATNCHPMPPLPAAPRQPPRVLARRPRSETASRSGAPGSRWRRGPYGSPQMRALNHKPWYRSLRRKGLVPTPAISVAATPVAPITPITGTIAAIPVIPVAAMLPVAPVTTVVAVVTASARTAKFEDFRNPHIVLSSLLLRPQIDPACSQAPEVGGGASQLVCCARPSALASHLRLASASGH